MLSVATVTFLEKHQIFRKRLEIGIRHSIQKFFFCFVRLMDKTKGLATSCRKMKFCTVLLGIFPVILHVRDLGQKYPFTLISLVNYLILSLFRFLDNDTVSCQTLVTITKSQTENLFWRLITLRTNSSSYCKLIISAVIAKRN